MTGPDHPSQAAQVQPAEPAIGEAQMLPDGTLVLDLRAQDNGITGLGRLTYPRSHPQYEQILHHLGGMVPGEVKLVRPWP